MAASASLQEQKAALRAECRARRDGIRAAGAAVESTGAASDGAGASAARHFLDLLPGLGLTGAGVAAGYWPHGSEIDPLPFMRSLAADGWTTCFPAIAPNRLTEAPLDFRVWSPDTRPPFSRFRIPAPDENAPSLLPDLVVVPLLAFDDGCHRLGYGGGYYDRTLAALRRISPASRAVGLAFDGQRREDLPVADHDARLDAVVTEKTVYTGPAV